MSLVLEESMFDNDDEDVRDIRYVNVNVGINETDLVEDVLTVIDSLLEVLQDVVSSIVSVGVGSCELESVRDNDGV